MKYTTAQINQVKEDIPQDLISALNTMKIHEVYSTPSGELFRKHMSKENSAQQFYLFKTNRKINLHVKQGTLVLFLPYKIILNFRHHNHIIYCYCCCCYYYHYCY